MQETELVQAKDRELTEAQQQLRMMVIIEKLLS